MVYTLTKNINKRIRQTCPHFVCIHFISISMLYIFHNRKNHPIVIYDPYDSLDDESRRNFLLCVCTKCIIEFQRKRRHEIKLTDEDKEHSIALYNAYS